MIKTKIYVHQSLLNLEGKKKQNKNKIQTSDWQKHNKKNNAQNDYPNQEQAESGRRQRYKT